VTTKNPGNVVMWKQSADAGSASLTLPNVPVPPAAPPRKASIHPLLEEQLLEAADTAGRTQRRKHVRRVGRE
jgi:hypothetical protein